MTAESLAPAAPAPLWTQHKLNAWLGKVLSFVFSFFWSFLLYLFPFSPLLLPFPHLFFLFKQILPGTSTKYSKTSAYPLRTSDPFLNKKKRKAISSKNPKFDLSTSFLLYFEYWKYEPLFNLPTFLPISRFLSSSIKINFLLLIPKAILLRNSFPSQAMSHRSSMLNVKFLWLRGKIM